MSLLGHAEDCVGSRNRMLIEMNPCWLAQNAALWRVGDRTTTVIRRVPTIEPVTTPYVNQGSPGTTDVIVPALHRPNQYASRCMFYSFPQHAMKRPRAGSSTPFANNHSPSTRPPNLMVEISSSPPRPPALSRRIGTLSAWTSVDKLLCS